jgi:hypothetical protein
MRAPELLAAPPPAFTRQGEIQFTPAGTAGSSAAWDARSVRGPAVNLTLTDQGLWGGTLQDRVVLLHARSGRITGEGVDVWVTLDGSVLHVQGLWFGRFVGIHFTPETISASPLTGVCAVELLLAPDGLWRGFGGCGGVLDYIWMSLKGVAADPEHEMPQWFFAFLGALPAPQVSVFRPGMAAASPVAGPGSIGYFLDAEFRGPPPSNMAPLPCSIYDQRLCGPFGYTGGYRGDEWSRDGSGVAVRSSAPQSGRDGFRGARGPSGAVHRNGGTGGSGERAGAPASRPGGGGPATRGGSGAEARAARTSAP